VICFPVEAKQVFLLKCFLLKFLKIQTGWGLCCVSFLQSSLNCEAE